MPVPSAPTVALAAAGGQGWLQVTELLLAFVLSSAIGLERQLRGKSASLRTRRGREVAAAGDVATPH